MFLILPFGTVDRALARSVISDFLCNDILRRQSRQLSFEFDTCRRITRNFSGQGKFLKIRALRYTFNCNTKKKGPSGKNFGDFFPRYT